MTEEECNLTILLCVGNDGWKAPRPTPDAVRRFREARSQLAHQLGIEEAKAVDRAVKMGADIAPLPYLDHYVAWVHSYTEKQK